MRTKEEQRELSYQRIDKQAEELISVYGWNEQNVVKGQLELKGRVWNEVESFGDHEDLVNCWSLVDHMSNLKINMLHDKGLSDNKEAEPLRILSYDIQNKFRYVEDAMNDELKLLVFINQKNEGVIVVEYDNIGAKGNQDYIYLKYDDVAKWVDEHGIYEVLKKIYKKIQDERAVKLDK